MWSWRLDVSAQQMKIDLETRPRESPWRLCCCSRCCSSRSSLTLPRYQRPTAFPSIGPSRTAPNCNWHQRFETSETCQREPRPPGSWGPRIDPPTFLPPECCATILGSQVFFFGAPTVYQILCWMLKGKRGWSNKLRWSILLGNQLFLIYTVYMHAHKHMWVPVETRRGHQVPWSWIAGSCDSPSLGPLEKQQTDSELLRQCSYLCL